MFKRAVSLLLLPTLLLTQWASAGHCYGCRHAAGHDRTPHVHLTSFPFTGATPQADGQNDPGDQGCCHRHGDQDSADQDGELAPQEVSTDQRHGGGVFYLPMSLIHGWLSGRASSSVDDLGPTVVLALCDGLMLHLQSLVSTHHPPAFLSVSDCPALLRTLPLLI